MGAGQRHAEDGVGAEARLVGRAVQLDEELVDRLLICDVVARNLGSDLVVHIANGGAHPLAPVAGRVAITQFARLVRAGRCTRRDRGTPQGAVGSRDVDFDGGVGARVENLARMDRRNCGHFERT
jgi:hypothetical protein